MSLARGKYGVEYNPAHMDDDSSGLGWIVLAVVVVALLSLVWTLVSRFRSADPADVAPLKKLSKTELARVRVPLYQSWDMGVSVLTNFDAARHELTVSPGCTRPILFWNKFRPRFKLQNLRAALDGAAAGGDVVDERRRKFGAFMQGMRP